MKSQLLLLFCWLSPFLLRAQTYYDLQGKKCSEANAYAVKMECLLDGEKKVVMRYFTNKEFNKQTLQSGAQGYIDWLYEPAWKRWAYRAVVLPDFIREEGYSSCDSVMHPCREGELKYYLNNRWVRSEFYKQDSLYREVRFYNSGADHQIRCDYAMKEEGHLRVRNGPAVFYYKSGAVLARALYENGYRKAPWVCYSQNNMPSDTVDFVNRYALEDYLLVVFPTDSVKWRFLQEQRHNELTDLIFSAADSSGARLHFFILNYSDSSKLRPRELLANVFHTNVVFTDSVTQGYSGPLTLSYKMYHGQAGKGITARPLLVWKSLDLVEKHALMVVFAGSPGYTGSLPQSAARIARALRVINKNDYTIGR